MSTEKRLVLFLVLFLPVMWGTRIALDQLGLLPPPPKRQAAPPADRPVEVAKAAPQPESKPEPKAEAPKPDVAPAQAQEVALARPDELVLGSVTDKSPDGFRLEVRLDQKGAGVAQVRSSQWEAEIVEGRPRNRPLMVIDSLPGSPPSFTLSAASTAEQPEGDPAPSDEADDPGKPIETSFLVKSMLWDVVRDAQGRAVTDVTRTDPRTRAIVKGREITFATQSFDGRPLTVTRTYRLWPGEDGFDMDLTFSAPGGEQALSYILRGPHGIPIEGEWYTGTFRDIFFGGVEGTATRILTLAAYNIAKTPETPERYTTLPLKFAGVENQYFAAFLAPVPPPTNPEQSRIAEARSAVVGKPPQDLQKADVTVELISNPFAVPADGTVRHSYRIFAGPKTYAALAPFGAADLSTYRKGWSLPVIGDVGASFMAKQVIAPMLDAIYNATASIARAFGGRRGGNYGIAIILLTMTVRLILFPLGRKQARAAKKMQDLQPLMAKLKEQCGDDKEKLTRETFALYKQYGVNPMGGCLPALIQLPVLIGLWQALNNSVMLRHSSFLWIRNLAAPDQLFKFPFDMPSVPLIGWAIGPYFNLLPILVVSLMLVQTKLFAPPATTPEAEQQQKMMKYMMFFMAFMFYKVPAGLGIYFITSSLWQIGERLLLPKGGPLEPLPAPSAAPAKPDRGNGKPPRPGAGPADPQPAGQGGWWRKVRSQAQERIEQIMADAEKEKSARRDDGPDRGERGRPKPKPGRKR